MKYEEKLEFKKEIFKEIKNCILFDGKGYSLNKKELSFIQKDMGMIFQNFNLLNRLNVFVNSSSV